MEHLFGERSSSIDDPNIQESGQNGLVYRDPTQTRSTTSGLPPFALRRSTQGCTKIIPNADDINVSQRSITERQ